MCSKQESAQKQNLPQLPENDFNDNNDDDNDYNDDNDEYFFYFRIGWTFKGALPSLYSWIRRQMLGPVWLDFELFSFLSKSFL